MSVCVPVCVTSFTVIAGLNLKFELLTTEQDFYTAAEGTYSRTSYCILLCNVMSCHVMLCHVMLYYVMFCHVMLYYVMLRHVMLCYVM